MGPTNLALVKLMKADEALRAVKTRLDDVQKNVRVQDRKVKELTDSVAAVHTSLREKQASAANLELDIKTRDEHIEKLRDQQRNATNAKIYQTFLLEINTGKVDRAKVEDETMKVLEAIEKQQAEVATLTASLETETKKLTDLQAQIGDSVARLSAEVEQLRGPRDAAAEAVPLRARQIFERLAEHHDGQAIAAIAKPDRRTEEYLCTNCNMNLVADVYNKLHSRDELVYCPSCRLILYIPEDLPPDQAVKKRKERPAKKEEPAAAATVDAAPVDAPRVDAQPANAEPADAQA